MSEFRNTRSEKLQPIEEKYEEIRAADPLGFDRHVEDLVAYNHAKETNLIINLLHEAATKTRQILPNLGAADAAACIRDIDFLVSSLVAHGVKPFEYGGDVERVLLNLASITGTVPRGTSFTYGNGNPEGRRQRTFTGDAQEGIFIDAIARSSMAISHSLSSLSDQQGLSTDVSALTSAVEAAMSSMISVKRTVTPDFFTNQLRPYLELWTVDGRDYFGPGGIQTLLPVDLILWGVDETSEMWIEFVETNYPYLDQVQKESLNLILGKNGGKSVYAHALDSGNPNMQRNVYNCLQALKKFRYPHRKLVQDNVGLAEDEDTYADSIVDVLLNKTIILAQELENRLLNQT